jgi:hypothetical protein
MQVGVLDQTEDMLCSRITDEFNAQSVKYMSEALNPPVFSGSYYSAGIDQFRLSPANIPGFIEFARWSIHKGQDPVELSYAVFALYIAGTGYRKMYPPELVMRLL